MDKKQSDFFIPSLLMVKFFFTCAICVMQMTLTISYASEATSSVPKKFAAGFIIDAEGDCKVVSDSSVISRVRLGMFVYERDILKTGKKSTMKIMFSNGVETRLRQNSEMSILEIPPSERGLSSKVKMVVGGLFSRVVKQKTKFDVNTPVVTIAVRGTEFDTEVGGNGLTEVKVFKGVVALQNEFGSRTLNANSKSTVIPGEAPSAPAPLTAEDHQSITQAAQDSATALTRNSIKIELPLTVISVGETITGSILIKDADDLIATDFKDKISISVSGGALISEQGKNRWRDMISEITPDKGEFKFDIKGVEAGERYILSAVSKVAAPAQLEVTVRKKISLSTGVSTSDEKTLILDIKEGNHPPRQIKIRFKKK